MMWPCFKPRHVLADFFIVNVVVWGYGLSENEGAIFDVGIEVGCVLNCGSQSAMEARF